MGEILIPRRTKVERAYELLADITVGTATTSVDITGLNIGKGDEVVLVCSIMNNSTLNGCNWYLFANNNTTVTNYYNQDLYSGGTTIAPIRNNTPTIGYTAPSGTKTTSFNVAIKLTNSGYFVAQSSTVRELGGSSVAVQNQYLTSTFTLSAVTSLKIEHQNTGQPNQLAVGSRFQLYKIGGA